MNNKPTDDEYEEVKEGHFTYRRAKPKTDKEVSTMDKQTANIAIQFLSRVNLNAEEIPAFMQVKNALEELSVQEPVVRVVEDEPDMKLK